jgi:hypothetical protein
MEDKGNGRIILKWTMGIEDMNSNGSRLCPTVDHDISNIELPSSIIRDSLLVEL